MGKGNTGGHVAAPVFGNFMKWRWPTSRRLPFRIPPGIKLVRVSLRTGLRVQPGDTDGIMEAFKPGEEPDDAYSVIGFSDPSQTGAPPEEGGPPPPPSAYPPRPRPSFGTTYERY